MGLYSGFPLKPLKGGGGGGGGGGVGGAGGFYLYLNGGGAPSFKAYWVSLKEAQ